MFIEKIYRGGFDSDLFRASGPALDYEKTGPILDSYRDILKEFSPELLQEKEGLPPGMIERMRSAGLFGLTIEPEYGGLGLNLKEYLLVVREMVKLDISIAITFLAHLSIGIKAISLFGNEDQKKKYLPLAASGQMIFAYALTEPRIGSDAQHIETIAIRGENTDYILNGQKAYITNGNYAGGLTVFAQLDQNRPGFLGAFIVETGWEGVKVGMEMPKMGLKASSTAAIRFKDVRAPQENMIGRPGDGFKIAMSVLNYGRLGLGAASAAVLQASARDMLARSSSRVQFQVPIKSFQLVQEKIVRAEVNAAVSSAMNTFIAGALETAPLLPMAIETSHCKLFGTTRAWEAVYDGLQVAGGSGYLKTLPYEKRMRDFRVATVFEGTTEIHSIYPALLGMRQLGKWLKASDASFFSLAAEMFKAVAGRMNWPVRFENATMQKALREAKRTVRSVRLLLLAGLLFYGKKIQRGEIGKREYFFRRITTLSTYSFGLLCLLSELDKKHQAGGLTQKDLDILACFTAEAAEVRKQNRHFFDSRKERLASALFDGLDA